MFSLTRLVIVATAALTLAAESIAQVGSVDVDRLSNWAAPLYFQPASTPTAEPLHHGRIREEAAVRAAGATLGTPAVFVAMSPCRVMDTRYSTAPPSQPFGAPPFAASETRTVAVPSGPCAVPSNAVAYSLNIAVIPNPPGSAVRWLTAWDTGSTQPNAATLNDKAGLVTSNSAVVPAGTSGSIDVFVTDPTNVIIDINGYYAPPSTLPLTGTAAAPAVTFGDTTTGLYSDAAGTVSIATAGVNRLTVDANGDVDLPGSIRRSGLLLLHTDGDALGVGLDALKSNAGNRENTAFGTSALAANSTGGHNTAVGWLALSEATNSSNNTVVGANAFDGNGSSNSVLGAYGMFFNSTGDRNIAVGDSSLVYLGSGSDNIGIGVLAGANLGTGDSNVYIANEACGSLFGQCVESGTVRIGGASQARMFLAGTRGVTTGNPDAIPVVIDSNGQLGTASSSRRVKRDIEDMGDTTDTILALHPVRFRYTQHTADSPLQYGLIAEEVAEIAPDLVARNKDGEIETVYYDKVNAMLLNEVQKLTREKDALADTVRRLELRIVDLESRAK